MSPTIYKLILNLAPQIKRAADLHAEADKLLQESVARRKEAITIDAHVSQLWDEGSKQA